MVLRLRGGMYHPIIRGEWIEEVGKRKTLSKSNMVQTMTYEIEIDLNKGETYKSLLGRVKEKIAAIDNLRDRIDSIKRGAGGEKGIQSSPKKKQKTST